MWASQSLNSGETRGMWLTDHQAERHVCWIVLIYWREQQCLICFPLSVQAWYGWPRSWPCVFKLFWFFYFALFSLFSLGKRQSANHWHIGGEYFQPIKSLINPKDFVAIHIKTLCFPHFYGYIYPIYWIFITTFIFGSWLGLYVLFRLCLFT